MGPRKILFLIFLLVAVAFFIDLPREFNIGSKKINLPVISISMGNFQFQRDLEPKLGLDVSGGSHLTFEADMSMLKPEDRDAAHQASRETVSRRVNLFGVSEPVVQTSKVEDSYRIVVELPGVTDTGQAVSLIGQTAQLVFAEYILISPSPIAKQEEATPSAQLIPTDLTGKDVTRAQVEFDPNTGKPVVGLQFTPEGSKKFETLTDRNIGKPIAIVLDRNVVSAPIVEQKISGNAIIQGQFTVDYARELAALINAGALPVPLKIIEQRTVGPTLGKESINASVRAGLVGVGAVALFMILYYGRMGVISTVSLLIYGILTFALFKFIPVVLTLPGIAGFLLSVGMAVDSNILIFERFKEEIRRGLGFADALESAFGRAWDSIRDANIATLLTSFILFNPLNWDFLHTSGPVRGFAATLALGVFMSLFTGVVVTRTLLRVFSRK